MKPITRILVTLDLDLVTAPVLDLACRMALAFGARVDLIHVFETEGYHGPAILDLATTPEADVERWRTARVMLSLLRHLAEGGVTARGRVAMGVVEEEVCSLAREEDFDLIIVGSHCREGLDRLMNASVAAALIRMAPCPVLVLPHVQDVIPD